MIFYFSVALLLFSSIDIFKTDQFELPSLLTSLTLNPTQVPKVFKLAQDIKKKTPNSFTYIICNEKILSRSYSNLKMAKTVERLEKLPALPMNVQELLYYCYPNQVKCDNPFCDYSLFTRAKPQKQQQQTYGEEEEESKSPKSATQPLLTDKETKANRRSTYEDSSKLMNFHNKHKTENNLLSMHAPLKK